MGKEVTPMVTPEATPEEPPHVDTREEMLARLRSKKSARKVGRCRLTPGFHS